MKQVKVCPTCGERTKEKSEDTGYISGRDLGRPRGAKGVDTFRIWDECPKCGEVSPVLSNPPCYLCGNTSTKEINGLNLSQELGGPYDWIPGLPNYPALCESEACMGKLKALAKRMIEKAINEGGYE